MSRQAEAEVVPSSSSVKIKFCSSVIVKLSCHMNFHRVAGNIEIRLSQHPRRKN